MVFLKEFLKTLEGKAADLKRKICAFDAETIFWNFQEEK